MKRILIIIILTITSYLSYADSLVYVIHPTKIKLNSSMRIGGKNKNVIYLPIPTNTKSLILTYVVNEDTSTIQMNVLANATKFIDFTGAVSGIISSINVPTGTGIIDFYLIPRYDNSQKFINSKSFGRFHQFDRLNANNGKMEIPKINEELYLAFENTNYTKAMYINLEVIALLKD